MADIQIWINDKILKLNDDKTELLIISLGEAKYQIGQFRLVISLYLRVMINQKRMCDIRCYLLF